jgi:hypothetical protein
LRPRSFTALVLQAKAHYADELECQMDSVKLQLMIALEVISASSIAEMEARQPSVGCTLGSITLKLGWPAR